MTPPPLKAPIYCAAGVDLDASDATLARIKSAVTASYTPQVLAGLGAFGGLYDAAALKRMDAPVLVASIDGVGTKTKVASALGRFDTLGGDLVNHCVNDLLVQGATPLFFLDYVATARLEPETMSILIGGVAAACQAHGIPLLGGETAEMPGVYEAGEFDLVGTLIGLVERAQIVTGERIEEGDRILGLASGGPQTNGFSLARRVLDGHYSDPLGETTVGEALLAPHRSFLGAASPLLEAGLIRGMAHITGGGIPGNLPRILPEGLGAEVGGEWPVPDIFTVIQARGSISREEMFQVFNMGIGFVFVVAPNDVSEVRARCPETLYDVGTITRGAGVRLL